MYKVFIWGTGYWGNKCFCDILPEVDIIGFVESEAKQRYFHERKVISGQELAAYEYDFVILANTHEDEIKQRFALDEQKIYYYRQKSKLNDAIIFQHQLIDHVRKVMPYLSVECDGLAFLYNKTDILIPQYMCMHQEVWSKGEMDFFWREAPRYRTGIFIDIGANIGTTSIYFKKKLAQDFTYIAFEPVKENYRVLKSNCILNDCEDITIENMGISDTEGVKGLTVVEANYGGSVITDSITSEESCQTITLDEYIKINKIAPQDIAYIWMDIEGHEANAIEGAKELLSQSKASLFMEYNAVKYRMNGKLEDIYHNLGSIYTSFICYEQYTAGRTEKRNIDELVKLADEMQWQQCNILFMK